MITAVDTNVLIDIFEPDPEFGPSSQRALRGCLAQGSLVACNVVWAEVAARFESGTDAYQAMDKLRVEFGVIEIGVALSAGAAWKSYQQRGGQRERLIPDFLIAAHALARADRLLTRDRGFYRSYFTELEVLDPTTANDR